MTSTAYDTYPLHHGASARRSVLLEKLGGDAKKREAIDRFYEKQMNDPRLMHFFDVHSVEVIKWHQFNLMSIAFTPIPDNFDLRDLLLKRHVLIFDQGLDEGHFDLVAEHFTSTLRDMHVDDALIEEALEVVMPLREIFEEGARLARERRGRAVVRKRAVQLAVVAVVATAVVVAAVRIAKSRRHKE